MELLDVSLKEKQLPKPSKLLLAKFYTTLYGLGMLPAVCLILIRNHLVINMALYIIALLLPPSLLIVMGMILYQGRTRTGGTTMATYAASCWQVLLEWLARPLNVFYFLYWYLLGLVIVIFFTILTIIGLHTITDLLFDEWIRFKENAWFLPIAYAIHYWLFYYYQLRHNR